MSPSPKLHAGSRMGLLSVTNLDVVDRTESRVKSYSHSANQGFSNNYIQLPWQPAIAVLALRLSRSCWGSLFHMCLPRPPGLLHALNIHILCLLPAAFCNRSALGFVLLLIVILFGYSPIIKIQTKIIKVLPRHKTAHIWAVINPKNYFFLLLGSYFRLTWSGCIEWEKQKLFNKNSFYFE